MLGPLVLTSQGKTIIIIIKVVRNKNIALANFLKFNNIFDAT